MPPARKWILSRCRVLKMTVYIQGARCRVVESVTNSTWPMIENPSNCNILPTTLLCSLNSNIAATPCRVLHPHPPNFKLKCPPPARAKRPPSGHGNDPTSIGDKYRLATSYGNDDGWVNECQWSSQADIVKEFQSVWKQFHLDQVGVRFISLLLGSDQKPKMQSVTSCWKVYWRDANIQADEDLVKTGKGPLYVES